MRDRSGLLLRALARGERDKEALRAALLLRGPAQRGLFSLARERRDACFPPGWAELRCVIELSNACGQRCRFCNMRRGARVPPYLLPRDEFRRIARRMLAQGRRVFLLQSGENRSDGFAGHVCGCVEDIKRSASDAVVILCLGSLERRQYRRLRDAGADRYILKFETSNPSLYKRLKPGDSLKDRLRRLETLSALGFKVGSGNMVGLPGQTIDDVVRDLLLLERLKPSMASSSVFIPGETSPYKGCPVGDVDLALNCMALVRLLLPHALIPATSSLEKAAAGSQHRGLMAGANAVTVHDGTPKRLQPLFPIYSTRRFTPGRGHIRGILRRAGLRI